MDLYYRYFDLIKFRYKLRTKICQSVEFGSILEPELPGTHENDLIVLENEEQKLYSELKGKTTLDNKIKKVQDINNQRIEIFNIMDKDELESWSESQYENNPTNLMKYLVHLRYVEFKVEKLINEILNARKSTSVKDPFEYLTNKYKLMEEEIELLIFLYYSNFDCADAIRGDTLLEIILGRQWQLFSSQNILFEDSSLLKNNLIQIVRQGYNALSSYYAISEYSNLIISDLHPEFRHLTAKLIKNDRPIKHKTTK